MSATDKPEAKSNVIVGEFHTSGDVPVEHVRQAAEASCEKLLCIGINKDGEPYYASSFGDQREALWMIEEFKLKMLSGKFS